jgi:hypothetical protein
VVSSLPLLLGDTGISNHLPGILFASSQRAAIQFNSIPGIRLAGGNSSTTVLQIFSQHNTGNDW